MTTILMMRTMTGTGTTMKMMKMTMVMMMRMMMVMMMMRMMMVMMMKMMMVMMMKMMMVMMMKMMKTLMNNHHAITSTKLLTFISHHDFQLSIIATNSFSP